MAKKVDTSKATDEDWQRAQDNFFRTFTVDENGRFIDKLCTGIPAYSAEDMKKKKYKPL